MLHDIFDIDSHYQMLNQYIQYFCRGLLAARDALAVAPSRVRRGPSVFGELPEPPRVSRGAQRALLGSDVNLNVRVTYVAGPLVYV